MSKPEGLNMLTRFKDLTADFAKRFLSITGRSKLFLRDEDETQNEAEHFSPRPDVQLFETSYEESRVIDMFSKFHIRP